MKKIIAYISFACYFAVTSGIVINSHYCIKRQSCEMQFKSEKRYPGKCGMHAQKNRNCCHNEVKVVKLVQDQNTISIEDYNRHSIAGAGIVASQFIVASAYNIVEKYHFHNHSPPLLSAQDTYLQINVFRI
ncbi:MAG TPA: hypothetical protein VN451_04580 [Chitinophagaceae bacterium]|nr:hypothetical protein [Chitinophagaceae bacterium]